MRTVLFGVIARRLISPMPGHSHVISQRAVDRLFHHQDAPAFDRTRDAIRDVSIFVVDFARLPEQFAELAGAAVTAAFQVGFDLLKRFGSEFAMLFDLRRRIIFRVPSAARREFSPELSYPPLRYRIPITGGNDG